MTTCHYYLLIIVKQKSLEVTYMCHTKPHLLMPDLTQWCHWTVPKICTIESLPGGEQPPPNITVRCVTFSHSQPIWVQFWHSHSSFYGVTQPNLSRAHISETLNGERKWSEKGIAWVASESSLPESQGVVHYCKLRTNLVRVQQLSF